jgi:hypothetical protein
MEQRRKRCLKGGKKKKEMKEENVIFPFAVTGGRKGHFTKAIFFPL